MPLKYKYNDTWIDYNLEVYPVGSLYFSLDVTSPADLFGGTWSKINNTNYLRLNSGNSAAGSTGGSSSVNHTHQLPIGWDRMSNNNEPRIWGWQDINGLPNFGSNVFSNQSWQLLGFNGANITNISGATRMAIAAHTSINITPTYMTINVWERKA